MAGEVAESPVLLVDARPLEGPTGQRGVGRYVSSLLEGLREAGSRWTLARAVGRARGMPDERVVCDRPGPDLFWSRFLGPGLVSRSGADLYHATFLAPLRVPRSFPWVATIHDLIPLRHPAPFTLRQRVAFGLSLRWSADATRVVTVSPFTADLVARSLGVSPGRIRVVAPPVDVGGVEQGVAGAATHAPLLEGRYLLHTSGFDPLKGVHDLLVPALALLAADHSELQLVMTGPRSAWRDRAERVAAELGLSHCVHFPGLVSDEERAVLLRHAAALVVPSREEGFGIPAIEGLAAGLPVVVGPAEATRWAVGDQGHLAKDPSPEGLADAIRAALEAAGRDDASAAAARRAHARRFAPVEIARQMIEVYEEALG